MASPSSPSDIYQTEMRRIGLYSAVNRISQWSSNKRFSTNTNTHHDIGFTDAADLLSTPERDYLIRNHAQKVPVSSLRGKLVGLYLCEIMSKEPPRLKAIQMVYEQAKLRGFDFEIVQITFDFKAERHATSPIVHHFREDILWLTLPPMDPRFKKIQNIFRFADDKDVYWGGDSLVLIHPPHAHADGSSNILIEFSGADIIQRWGIEGYPFTRSSLYKVEYELLKREAPLRWFFPPGECCLRRPRPAGDGFDHVDALSHLLGKRVIVLFANHSLGFIALGDNFLSLLKSEYNAQLEDNVAGESKFEVVYVSTGSSVSSFFDKFTKDMPWWVDPFPSNVNRYRLRKVFKQSPTGLAAVAFNEQGELVAKEDYLDGKKEIDKPHFPFIEDLEKRVRLEVEAAFKAPTYYRT